MQLHERPISNHGIGVGTNDSNTTNRFTLYMDSYVLILATSSGKNLQLAHRFSESFRNEGMATQIVDLTTLHWPVYTPELDGNRIESPIRLHALRTNSPTRKHWSSALRIQRVMPPALNNTIAWLSVQSDDFRRLFNNRTVLLATHSGGGSAHCLMAMRHSSRSWKQCHRSFNEFE